MHLEERASAGGGAGSVTLRSAGGWNNTGACSSLNRIRAELTNEREKSGSPRQARWRGDERVRSEEARWEEARREEGKKKEKTGRRGGVGRGEKRQVGPGIQKPDERRGEV